MVDLARLNMCFIAGTLGQGGAERQLFYMVRALKQAGARVRLLSLTRGEFWEQPIRDLGVPITWVGSSASRLARLGAMLRVLRSDPPAIVQSAHFYTNIYAVAIGAALGSRSIGALRNDGLSELRATGNFFGRLSMRLPPTLVANSALGMRNARTLGVPERRLRFLPNVVDCDLFSVAGQMPHSSPTLLYIGRLEPQKRVDRFVRLVARLRAAGDTKFRAIIVGSGSLRAQLEQQAAVEKLLSETLEFRGSVGDPSVVYHEADLLVLTSDWEGTPNVVLEAMACGLPVVATRAGGVPDIVRDGETGYLTESQDEDTLYAKTRLLLADSQLRSAIGGRARSFMESHHAPELLPTLLAEIYTEVWYDRLGLAADQR